MTKYCIFGFGLLILVASGCGGENTYKVKTESIVLDSLSQIVPVTDSLVKPILYTNVKSFEDYKRGDSRKAFISAILPAILVAKHNVETTRIKLERLREKRPWERVDSLFYRSACVEYGAKSLDDLLIRIITLPNSIVIAQAAVETGWGRARFFVEAKNVFGIWSFVENEKRVMAGQGRSERRIYVRLYDDLSGSVEDYFKVLARSRAFRTLRSASHITSEPDHLIPHLRNYSERRSAYTMLLKKVVRQNDLSRYDNYRIDPDYLEEED